MAVIHERSGARTAMATERTTAAELDAEHADKMADLDARAARVSTMPYNEVVATLQALDIPAIGDPCFTETYNHARILH